MKTRLYSIFKTANIHLDQYHYRKPLQTFTLVIKKNSFNMDRAKRLNWFSFFYLIKSKVAEIHFLESISKRLNTDQEIGQSI